MILYSQETLILAQGSPDLVGQVYESALLPRERAVEVALLFSRSGLMYNACIAARTFLRFTAPSAMHGDGFRALALLEEAIHGVRGLEGK